jgi:hypothetical protein
MRTSLRLTAIVVLALPLLSCGRPESGGTGTIGSSPAPSDQAASASASSEPTPTAVLPDGRSPVIVTAVDVSGRKVTFDLVELYLGTQAAVEWKKDHPGATEVPPLNGHYMRNNNPKLRTLPVAPDVVVKVLDQYGDPVPGTVLPFDQLPGYRGLHGVFWITVKDGVVTMFEEQFFP